ncbi:hypothetical protein FRC08_006873 [Ceratobasidium sp. 394]|nr:hypothetical protein FRC08_006873 [Ceratobasidium sp. 394]
MKSQDERTRLVSDVILAPGFSPEHFKGLNLRAMDSLIDSLDLAVVDKQGDLLPYSTGDGWRSHELKISVPRSSRAGARARTQATVSSETFDEFGDIIDVPGLRTRSLVNVIRTHFSAPSSESIGPLHYVPYQHYWQHGVDSQERIYDDLYTGDAWLEEHERIQRLPVTPGCEREQAIVAMMFSSDATHIGQFGQSYLWPIYLYFGNNSKWDRRRPSSRVSEHVAYIPKMSDEVKSKIEMLQSGKLQPALLAHCKREIFHNCWRILLDDDFIDAYKHGMNVKYSNGVERCLYPRIFTYSADYPEKVLIATIKDFGTHPCPRCLIIKPELSQLGLAKDMNICKDFRRDGDEQRSKVLDARRLAYHDGYVVNSSYVEKILSSMSGVPTLNAFSTRLISNPAFNLHQMLVPDFLHEVELGWQHSILVLQSFRQITSYPPDTIRKFHHNVSGMKRLAARDYEDILQCCGPCFEGLFPPGDDAVIQQLLFTVAHWHALAKLRVQTTTTLNMLRTQTTVLARRLRRFQTTIAVRYNTVETDNEHEKQKRQETRRALATGSVVQSTEPHKRGVKFNLTTYKFHALGDYPDTIEKFGTTNSYSTQIGELEHRRAKAHARRASQAQLVEGVTKVDRRQAYLSQRAKMLAKFTSQELTEQEHRDETGQAALYESLNTDDTFEHHHVGVHGTTILIGSFLQQHANDRALINFLPNLKDHLLLRFGVSPAETLQFTELQRQQLVIPSGKLIQHATIRVAYTTYDVRHSENVINP